MWKNKDYHNKSQFQKGKGTTNVKRFSFGKLFMGLCIAVLTFSFIVLIATGISSIRDVDYVSRYQSEEDYLSNLNGRDYLYLLELTHRDSRLEKEYSETVLECRAVAHYYEAASLYCAYTDAEDTEAAAEQMQYMVELAGQMGEFADHADKIDELFQIK